MFDVGGHFAQTLVNGLAVLGGFLAGYVMAGLIAKLLDRVLVLRKSPLWLHRIIRILGGVAVAMLVAMIVFGHGKGWNLFGGGADGTAEATGTQPVSTTAVQKTEPPPEPKTQGEAGDRIRVTILGGTDVKAERFYLLDDDLSPMTLAELKSAVLKRKESSSKLPTLEVRSASRNTLPTDHPAVAMLTRWAREVAGLNFTLISR